MKILQINKYHYIRGGSDTVYFNTTDLLRKHGHSVVHFAMEFPENVPSAQTKYFAKNEDFTQKSTINKVKSVPSFFYNKEAEEKLAKLIEEEKPDVAHLHIFYGSLTSSILNVLRKFHIPAVVSVHDYKFVCPAYLFLDGENEVCERCFGNKYYETVLNKCVKGSRLFSSIFAMESYYRDKFYPLHRMFSKLIFVSKFAEDIHKRFKPELEPISTHLYNFDPVLAEKVPNHNKGDYFLYAGRLSKEKGLRTLVKAFSNKPNLKLKVAGTGEEIEALKEIASSNIEFLGFKKGEELQSIISSASFVVVPSEWYENNPMAIIESYSLGKPVIAAKIGGIPEIIQHNHTGFIFNSGDVESLIKVIEEASELTENEYSEMSKAAVNFGHINFNPEVHFQELMAIYSEVISQKITV